MGQLEILQLPLPVAVVQVDAQRPSTKLLPAEVADVRLPRQEQKANSSSRIRALWQGCEQRRTLAIFSPPELKAAMPFSDDRLAKEGMLPPNANFARRARALSFLARLSEDCSWTAGGGNPSGNVLEPPRDDAGEKLFIGVAGCACTCCRARREVRRRG